MGEASESDASESDTGLTRDIVTTPPLDPHQPSAPDATPSAPADAMAVPAEVAQPSATAGFASDHAATSPLPATQSRRSRRGWVIGGVTAVAVAIIAGGSYAAYGFLSGGGAQPEDVVPANAVAFVKVDLDPAVGQKLAIARLASRFDSTTTGDPAAADGREPTEVFAGLLSDVTNVDIDYTRDLEGWVGQRAAVAVIPPGPGVDIDTTKPLVVVASTDDAAAQASLQRLFPADDGYAVAVRDGFALVGSPVDVAAPDRVLSDVDAFNEAEAAIGDNVALGYVDVDGFFEAAKAAGEDLSSIEGPLPDVASPIGRRAVSFGVVAEPDAISLQGHAYGLTEASAPGTAPLVLNQGAVALLGIRGLSDAVASAAKDAGGAAGAASLIDVDQIAAALGDLAEVQVAIGADGSPVIKGSIVSSDVTSTELFWQSLGALGGLSVTTTGDQVDIQQPEAAAAFGPATDLAPVTALLPNAATANLVAWVDVNAIEQTPAGAGVDERARQLKAAGLSISTATEGDAEVVVVAQFD